MKYKKAYIEKKYITVKILIYGKGEVK